MKHWQPTCEPFRVLSHVRSNDRLHYGWRSGVNQTFATRKEAEEFARSVAAGKVLAVYVHQAMNAPTWPINGRWRLVVKLIPGAKPQ